MLCDVFGQRERKEKDEKARQMIAGDIHELLPRLTGAARGGEGKVSIYPSGSSGGTRSMYSTNTSTGFSMGKGLKTATRGIVQYTI
jgi:hypothetical protein